MGVGSRSHSAVPRGSRGRRRQGRCLGAGVGRRCAQRLTDEGTSPRPACATGSLTRWTLLSLAPASAAASPDTELSSWLPPWAPPAGRGGGGGGVAPVGGGGTGGGGGGGGPPHERGALAADEGCPGGRMGPETQQGGAVSSRPPAAPPRGRAAGTWPGHSPRCLRPGWTQAPHACLASLALSCLSPAPATGFRWERRAAGGLLFRSCPDSAPS